MDDVRAPRVPGLMGRGRIETPLFAGRDEAFAALDAALDRAWRFRTPQFVTVAAGVGLGKSRLLAEWLDQIRGPHLRIVEASAAGAGTQGRPGETLAALLRSRFGLAPGWDAAAALAAFRLELAEVFGDRRVAEVAGLLGRWVGFDLPESPLAQALETRPDQRAELARAVLGRFLEQDAAREPMVWVLDNLELADDESLDVLENLAAELDEAPILFLMAARPELLLRRPAWGRGEGSHVRVDLAPLDRRAVDHVLRSMLGAFDPEPLPSALVERAAVESGGNPRLLGELLHLYHLHGALVAETGEGWWFDEERAAETTLEGVVSPAVVAEGRVAALAPSDRELLGRGACFGRVFWTGGVIALGRLGSEAGDPSADVTALFEPDAGISQVRARLAALADDAWIVSCETDVAQDDGWSFVSEDERLLLLGVQEPDVVRRRTSFAAQWLEARPGAGQPERRDRRLEALGALYEAAGDRRRAAYCLLTAAEGHRARLRPEEAMTLLARALPLLEMDDALAKLNALYDLGDLLARRGRAHEALGHFQEMLRIAWKLDLPAKGGVAHSRLGRLRAQLGEHRPALAHLEAAHRLFQLAGDRPGVAAALDDLGRLHLLAGEPEAALRRHGAALVLREELGDARGEALSLSRIAEVERELGELPAALAHAREAWELRRRFGDRLGLIASWLAIGSLQRDLGHPQEATEILREGRRAALEAGEELAVASFDAELGSLALASRNWREARSFFEASRERARLFGAKVLLGEAHLGLAEVALGEEQRADARCEASTAYALGRKCAVPTLMASALRVLALTDHAGDEELGGPRDMFERARSLLAEAGADLEMARTLTAYAAFEEAQGQQELAARLRHEAAQLDDRTLRATGAGRRPAQVDLGLSLV